MCCNYVAITRPRTELFFKASWVITTMLLERKKDWKEFLSSEDEEKLNELLKKMTKYRGAYQNAGDVKIAQMWCALLELHKENKLLQKRLWTVEDILEGMFEKIRKQERERVDLAKSLEKF